MNAEHIELSSLSKAKNIYVQHEGRHHTLPFYSYDCYSIFYIAHGSGYIEIDGTKTDINEGDIFIINPYIVHKIHPMKSLRRVDVYACYFKLSTIDTLWTDFISEYSELDKLSKRTVPFVKSRDNDKAFMRDIFIKMIDETINQPPCYGCSTVGYLIILINEFFRQSIRSEKKVYSSNPIVDDIIRHMHKCIYMRLSLSDISAYCGKSESYICRIFKKNTGMTTTQYLNKLRVNKIKDILKHTNKPPELIPELFQLSPEYIKHIFKSSAGMSMNQYKEKYKK